MGGCFNYGSTVGITLLMVLALNYSEGRPLDGTDICLMACDTCYKGETLLHCANECISTDGAMSAAWSRTCPTFAGNEIFSHRSPVSAEGFQKRQL